MDLLLSLGLPGIVFLALCVWLLRKVVRAARTEDDLEANRPEGALAEELQAAKLRAAGVAAPQKPVLQAVPPTPWMTSPVSSPGDLLARADVREANPEHLPLIAALVVDRELQLRQQHAGAEARRIEVPWVRSNAAHAVWLERRHAASPAARPREVICVARFDKGAIAETWMFG